ncbi:DUF523 and DUF1722 domain-containing protein [Clostridiaceae bacterium 35-E11]
MGKSKYAYHVATSMKERRDMMRKYEKPKVVLSQCLEHGNCRYDGSKIKSPFIKSLKEYVEFILVCPEVEVGLGVPRNALRMIEKDEQGEKLVFSNNGEEITEKMLDFSERFINSLDKNQIDGWILKSRSPSCGIKDVKVYKSFGKAQTLPKKTMGVFARKVYEQFGNIAIEDEGRLMNFNIREHFLTRVYTTTRFREVKNKKCMGELVKFHSQHKYLLMSYHQKNLKILGSIVANKEYKKIEDLLEKYEDVLLDTLKNPIKYTNNINMLLHLFGYFSKYLNSNEKAFFLDHIEAYRNKKIPFSVPLSIIQSWVIRFENAYLMEQMIFYPYPQELIEVTDSGKGRESIL